MHMIKKTHSVKSLSNTRDSEGSPGIEEVDTENEWKKANTETRNLCLKELKRSASMLLLLTFIMGDCHDGDTHRGPAILLISVNIEK